MRAFGLAEDSAPVELLAQVLPILAEIGGVLDPQALLLTIAQQLRHLVDYSALHVYLRGVDGTLSPTFSHGPTSPAARVHSGDGLVGTAAHQRQAIFVAEAGEGAGPKGSGAAALALPLLHRERLVGVIHLEVSDARRLGVEVRRMLELVAGHLAIAVQNASLCHEARSYADQLATLYEIGKETASILDLDELLQRLAEVVKRVIDYEMFGILLVDEEAGELVLKKAVSFGAGSEKTRIKIGEGLSGAAALSKKPVLVGDVRSDPRYVNLIPATRSELVVPLVYKDRVVGVFDLESSVVDRFTEEHLRILAPLASQVAVALENARLYDELSSREEHRAQELAIARRVQHGLFPEECPSGPGWQAAAHFRPANELGGDLYDFYDLGESLLGLAVGDVSGKGVPAALYGAFASGSVRARAFSRREPGEILAGVNRTLRRRGVEGLYCTLAFALFDFAQRRVRLANSGLPYPLHFQAATGRCLALELPGLPLGILDGSEYEERTIELAPGDVLAFHTDGVTEAERDGQDYGVARLREVIEGQAHKSASEIGRAVLDDLDRFLGEGESPSDDVTLVVVKAL